MQLPSEFVLVKWPDGSSDVWHGVDVMDVKTEDPDTGKPVEYMTVTLTLEKRSDHTRATHLLCPYCTGFKRLIGDIGRAQLDEHVQQDHAIELAKMKAASGA